MKETATMKQDGTMGLHSLYDISVYVRQHWGSRCSAIVDDIAYFGAVGYEHFGLQNACMTIGFANPNE